MWFVRLNRAAKHRPQSPLQTAISDWDGVDDVFSETNEVMSTFSLGPGESKVYMCSLYGKS